VWPKSNERLLLDTNIISEYNRVESPNPGVVQWMKTTAGTLQYLSVLTLGEIEKGILLVTKASGGVRSSNGLRTICSEVRRTGSCHRQGSGFVLGAIELHVPLLNPWDQP